MLRYLAAVVVAALPLASPSLAAEPAFTAWPVAIDWRPKFVGVELADLTLTQPRPLRVFALRIDLEAPDLSLVTDSSNDDRPEEVDGLKTSTFLLKTDCQAAINAAPFWPGQKVEGGAQNVAGLVVSEGELISPVDADKPRAALVVTKASRAEIRRPPVAIDDVVTAVGGYGIVLHEGSVTTPANELPEFVESLHPRTAIGIEGGGRTIYLVVVDGRQAGRSEGVRLVELGEILHRLGATEGLNLDGGGTSTMALAGGDGGFLLVNTPIEGGQPGAERIAASHLGVRATPLPSTQTPQNPKTAQSP